MDTRRVTQSARQASLGTTLINLHSTGLGKWIGLETGLSAPIIDMTAQSGTSQTLHMSWPEKGGTDTTPSQRPRRHYWNRYHDLPSLLSNSSTPPFLALVIWYLVSHQRRPDLPATPSLIPSGPWQLCISLGIQPADLLHFSSIVAVERLANCVIRLRP